MCLSFQSATSRLTVDKIEGIFHILAAGMSAGIVIVLFELLLTAKLDSVKSDGTVSTGGIDVQGVDLYYPCFI